MENDKKYGVFAEIMDTRVYYHIGLSSEKEAFEAIDRLDKQTFKIREGRPVLTFRPIELKPQERLLCRDGRFREVTPEGKVKISQEILQK